MRLNYTWYCDLMRRLWRSRKVRVVRISHSGDIVVIFDDSFEFTRRKVLKLIGERRVVLRWKDKGIVKWASARPEEWVSEGVPLSAVGTVPLRDFRDERTLEYFLEEKGCDWFSEGLKED